MGWDMGWDGMDLRLAGVLSSRHGDAGSQPGAPRDAESGRYDRVSQVLLSNLLKDLTLLLVIYWFVDAFRFLLLLSCVFCSIFG